MPLHVAVRFFESLPLTIDLIDEKGAYMSARVGDGGTALHRTASLDVIDALLDRGADLTLLCKFGWSPLMRLDEPTD